MNQSSGAKPASRIMIVEDEPLLRDTLEQLLQFSGFSVVTAGNGKEALDKLAQNPVDLVLSDIKMPVMDGVELLKNIRILHAGLKVIFFSAFADISHAEALQMGALDLLSKPVRIESLIEKIHASLAA
jgi:YesN/AraC family two-component response regulator